MQRQLNAMRADFSSLPDDVHHDLVIHYLINARNSIGQMEALSGYARQLQRLLNRKTQSEA